MHLYLICFNSSAKSNSITPQNPSNQKRDINEVSIGSFILSFIIDKIFPDSKSEITHPIDNKSKTRQNISEGRTGGTNGPNDNLLNQLWVGINPIDPTEWNGSSILEKFISILKVLR